jgi:hypothetical protein
MGAHRCEIVGRIAGEHRDLFCAVTDVHDRRNIFQPLFLGLFDFFRKVILCFASS